MRRLSARATNWAFIYSCEGNEVDVGRGRSIKDTVSPPRHSPPLRGFRDPRHCFAETSIARCFNSYCDGSHFLCSFSNPLYYYLANCKWMKITRWRRQIPLRMQMKWLCPYLNPMKTYGVESNKYILWFSLTKRQSMYIWHLDASYLQIAIHNPTLIKSNRSDGIYIANKHRQDC